MDLKVFLYNRFLMKMTKSSTSGPLLQLLLVLSGTSSILGLGVSRFYTYVDIFLTWEDARNYCKGLHSNGDLATLATWPDINDVYLGQYKAWVVLQKDNTEDLWDWIDGLHHDGWAWDEPDDDDTCAYFSNNNKRFYGSGCEEYYFFFCEDPSEDYDSSFAFVPQSKTWSEAKEYCWNNTELLENRAFIKHDFPVWIGLHRNDENEWQWARALSDYRNWADDEPSDDGDCAYVYSLEKSMATQNCSARLPFLCYFDKMVLIKEEKTWEEALEVCRGLGSPGQYDLASVKPGDDMDYLMYQILKADTEEVWSGLRFLAGSWLWVDGADHQLPDLPSCPHLGHYCGAFSKKKAGTVETRDCSERKNILCYML